MICKIEYSPMDNSEQLINEFFLSTIKDEPTGQYECLHRLLKVKPEFDVSEYEHLMYVIEKGSKVWYKDGVIHRDDDLPAKIDRFGIKYWYQNGKLDRPSGGPSIDYHSGLLAWYKNGLRHRDNGLPAIVYPDGTCYYYENGEKHRAALGPAGALPSLSNNPHGQTEYYYKGKSFDRETLTVLLHIEGHIFIETSFAYSVKQKPAIIPEQKKTRTYSRSGYPLYFPNQFKQRTGIIFGW